MPIIQCPQCSAELEIDAESAGQSVQCGSCNHVFTAKFPQTKPSKRVADDEDAPFKKPSQRASRDDDEAEERPSKRRNRNYDDDDDYDRRPRRRKPDAGKGLGIASMVCGIVGIVLSCCCLAIAPNIIAIILGILSLKTPGRSMGMAGLICGIIGLIITLGLAVARVGLGAANGRFGAGGFNNF